MQPVRRRFGSPVGGCDSIVYCLSAWFPPPALGSLSQGRPVEALAHLEEVLRLNPTNELAQRYARELRSKGQP